MRGTISRILPLKRSRNGNSYIRVSFKMEDGSFAETNLCPDFRNFGRWRDLLVVGKDLSGLVLKKFHEVDADSYPNVYRPDVIGGWVEHQDGTMEFIKQDEPVKIDPLPDINLIQPKLI